MRGSQASSANVTRKTAQPDPRGKLGSLASAPAPKAPAPRARTTGQGWAPPAAAYARAAARGARPAQREEAAAQLAAQPWQERGLRGQQELAHGPAEKAPRSAREEQHRDLPAALVRPEPRVGRRIELCLDEPRPAPEEGGDRGSDQQVPERPGTRPEAQDGEHAAHLAPPVCAPIHSGNMRSRLSGVASIRAW